MISNTGGIPQQIAFDVQNLQFLCEFLYVERQFNVKIFFHDIASLSNRSAFENIYLRKCFGLKMVGTSFYGPFASSPWTQPLNSDQRQLPFFFRTEVNSFTKKLL
jgi:hypothetical protein